MASDPQPVQSPFTSPGNRLSDSWAVNVGGVLPARPLSAILAQDERESRDRAELANAEPAVQELASHVRKCWRDAYEANIEVKRGMLAAARAKEGRYSPEMEAMLSEARGSTIYMKLFATKARQFKALVGDVLFGIGSEKPWTVKNTPIPDLPEDVTVSVLKEVASQVMQAEMSGVPMTQEEVRVILRDAHDKANQLLTDEARTRATRMEKAMEDMLAEGGFYKALDDFVDNLATYKTAFIKGPVVRKRGTLRWQASVDGGYEPIVAEAFRPFWEAPDPMKIYPSRGATSLQHGYLIEIHDLEASELEAMIGVDGYSEDALRAVIAEMSQGTLRTWTAHAVATERPDDDRPLVDLPQNTVEAVQFWGRVTGHMLLDWGVDEADIPDKEKSYDAEVWLVDRWVFKAVLNADPLARRPYYGTSVVPVPGRVWGQSLFDTMSDCEAMCNAAARALDVNMGISSGPQVGVDDDRLSDDENADVMYPWKVWRFTRDPMGTSTSVPITFFSPDSNAAELMGVYDRFSTLADEYTGVPRYMTGLAGGDGGAGRTASGMSMMIGNAGKTVKSVIASIDMNVLTALLEQLHIFIMRFGDDPEVKGDVNIVARGALSLAVKEAAQVRRNEFLAATNNPVDMQIVGIEGRAALLREAVKGLDVNPDLVVPPVSELRLRAKLQSQAQMAEQAQAAAAQQAQQAQPDQSALMNGAPVTQNFDPQALPSG